MDIFSISKNIPFRSIQVVHSANADIRNIGTSGGFVSGLIKYLFETSQIGGSVSYRFSGKPLFVPELIHRWADYNQSGSIYHEVNLIQFLKENLEKITPDMAIVCLPCQCLSIRKLMEAEGRNCLIVALTCSNQLSKGATYDFLRYSGVDIKKVKYLRYRGNGWPSGMEIEMICGNKHFFHNNKSDWPKYFHSTIYTLNRCFKCPDMFGVNADFVVADPWFQRYLENDTIGNSVVGINSERAAIIFKEMIDSGNLHINEELTKVDFVRSQYGTINKKITYKENPIILKIIKLYRIPIFKFIFHKFPAMHYRIHQRIIKYFQGK